MIPLPWRLLAMLVTLLALFGGGYVMGHKQESSACIAGQVQAQQAAQTHVDEINTQREQIAQSREISRDRIHVVYKTIKELADENVKNNPAVNTCDLDADGLRIWNAANSGEADSLPGESYLSMPSSATGEIGQSGRLIPEPRRGDGAGSAVPGSTEQASGVPETRVIYD